MKARAALITLCILSLTGCVGPTAVSMDPLDLLRAMAPVAIFGIFVGLTIGVILYFIRK